MNPITEIKINKTIFEVTEEFSTTSKENISQKLKKLILSNALNTHNITDKFTINPLK